MPFERNIEVRHKEKSDESAHAVRDITSYTTTVTAFEIGSRGYISPSNKQRLHYLHKFLKAGITLPKFQQNVSALSIYSSYQIFICRKDVGGAEPNLLEATIN